MSVKPNDHFGHLLSKGQTLKLECRERGEIHFYAPYAVGYCSPALEGRIGKFT